MKPVPTSVHGMFDYIVGIALLLAPNLFGFVEYGGAAVAVPRILGVIILIQALLTNYEFGALRVLPMKTHLMNDYLAGAFLAASPWLFGFSDLPANAWMPHLIVGLAVIGLAAMTQTHPMRIDRTAGARV